MQEIKKIINSFLQQEAETIYLMRQPNLEDYNKALQKMNDYCVNPLHNKFGMIPLTELDDQEYYDKWSKKRYPNIRHIYKISHYKDDKYGDVYVVYASLSNPIDEIFSFGDCFFVTKLNEELKIIKTYLFTSDFGRKEKFKLPRGLEDISFKTIKKPIEIERYLAPSDDKDGMEHYLKNI